MDLSSTSPSINSISSCKIACNQMDLQSIIYRSRKISSKIPNLCRHHQIDNLTINRTMLLPPAGVQMSHHLKNLLECVRTKGSKSHTKKALKLTKKLVQICFKASNLLRTKNELDKLLHQITRVFNWYHQMKYNRLASNLISRIFNLMAILSWVSNHPLKIEISSRSNEEIWFQTRVTLRQNISWIVIRMDSRLNWETWTQMCSDLNE